MRSKPTMYINEEGLLVIGECTANSLAKKFGTPLYVMDEMQIRETCRAFYEVLNRLYPNSLVAYASKAFSCTAIYQIVKSENLGVDVVSGGELFTALNGGVPADKIYFHGNNKSITELNEAVKAGVHAVVIDSLYEIEQLSLIAKKNNLKQRVLIRVNPGVEAHTHHFVQTARVDSKFGFSISDGAAIQAIDEILKSDSLDFVGIHCHIGSQIFEVKPFELAVDKMTSFVKEIQSTFNIAVQELNMGGGYGITYTDEDKPLKPKEYVEAIVNKLNECIKEKNITPPRLVIEPGRSIVGEAGVTLYTIGTIKEIKDIKKYVCVDGGLFDNPRYALYKSKYDAIVANKANEKPTQKVTIAGKCCESGDILIEEIMLPNVSSGDILAVLSTGAYNYSMSSHYNRNLVPPVVLVNGSNADYIVKPESYQDLIVRDVKIKD